MMVAYDGEQGDSGGRFNSEVIGMIKALTPILAAVTYLLLPCVTHAADPSANLSRKVACDRGPALALPISVVQAAGFTRCVLNADFTQVGGFFSKTSYFIDGCGGIGTKIFQAYYAYSGVQVPC